VSDARAPLPEALTRPDPGPVLLFAPHPDDDLIGPGCTAALHRAQGDPVHVVIAYDGAAGTGALPEAAALPGPEFVALRQREARAGGAHLGLTDYELWGFPEGHEPGPTEFEAGVGLCLQTLERVRPRTVYAPWLGEHHLDHHVLGKVVRAALERAGFDGAAWGYEVWSPLVPTRVVDVTDLFERKAAGLAEHRSQLAHTDLIHCIRGLNAHRSLYLPAGRTYAEAFAPL
jgi:LmbE family N-acetylglucosaminyl deacetylase